MSLRRVDLSTDVYFVCLNHAMCTEGEEIVGLLVGEVDEERVAHVVAVLILRRSDKRKDRVEISPEQLSNASTEAEKLACILKRPVRVIGWYHSHPKLTVYPSLVDVCTQESYQMMDEGFIGMIFSVFNPDPNKFGGRIQMICYQSQSVIIDCNIEKSHVEIPVQLVPSSYISDVCMNTIVQLPRSLCQEEQLAYQMANQVPLDYLTRLHNSSVYLRKMGEIAEVICGPLLKMLEERILNNEMKRKRLQERKKALTAQIEKIKRENAEKEKKIQEKTKLKEQENISLAPHKDLETIEVVELEKQNSGKEFQEKGAISEMNVQVATFFTQNPAQLFVVSPENKEQEIVIPDSIEHEVVIADGIEQELVIPDSIEQEEMQLSYQEMQDPGHSKQIGEQALFRDLDRQCTFNAEEQNMQIGQLYEEQIMLEDYHVPVYDIQEFHKLHEQMLLAEEQRDMNKLYTEDKEIKDAIQLGKEEKFTNDQCKEEKLTNDQCKEEKIQMNILKESEQKNLQEEYQTTYKVMQNIVNVNMEGNGPHNKQDAPLKYADKKNELPSSASVGFDNSMPLSESVPKNAGDKCGSEFIKSVESLHVTDAIKKCENRSDISMCNIEVVSKDANQDQKFKSNIEHKSGEKSSLVMNIAMSGSTIRDSSNLQASPILSSAMQDTPPMEASTIKIKNQTVLEKKH